VHALLAFWVLQFGFESAKVNNRFELTFIMWAKIRLSSIKFSQLLLVVCLYTFLATSSTDANQNHLHYLSLRKLGHLGK
jgi:hypothetical protein